jgi:hypothetical protein
MDERGGCGIKPLQEIVQVLGTSASGAQTQALAKGVIAWRRRGEALKQRPEIETGAASDDGKMAASFDVSQRGAGGAGVVTGGGGLVEVEEIEAVVRDAGAFGRRRFGGADVETAIDRDGIATDDLTVEPVGQMKCERRLAAGGGADENQ